MADPVTQSPFISSSSSSSSFSSSSAASGQPRLGGCGGAGSASCADPPASSSSSSSSSSSQPVSLFAASPAGAEAAPGGQGSRGAFIPPPHPAVAASSSSSSSSSGVAPPKEPDSPESPFEVVPDRAAFDREYGPAVALLGEREVLSQIPEDRVCHFPAKPRAGHLAGVKNPTGLCRQTSGTAAALEEVSKCVREMHSFTNELLTWDLVERNGGNGVAGVTDPGVTDPGVTDPGTAGVAAAGVTDPGVANPGTVAVPDPGVAVTTPGVAVTAPGVAGITAPGAAGVAEPAPGVAGVAEPDSSGESDDTVIEETPPGETLGPRHRGFAGGARPPPPPPPLPQSPPRAGTGTWGEEGLTLQELGEPPRDTPNPPGHPPQAPPLLPRLAAHDLLFWRDVRKTGLIFGASLLLLLSLAAFSAVSVVAHLALALLSVTISLRVYKAVVQAVQKAEEGHPFRAYLELDLTLTPETFQAHAAAVALHLNRALRFLLRLFLVEDLVDSLKLAVVMQMLTYVGAVFNGITLLILAELLAFTLPPLYEKYKVQIDHYVGIARRQTKDLVAKIQAKLPGLAKKKPE